MVGDFYTDKWDPFKRTIINTGQVFQMPPSRDEFDALKREVETMKALLIKAKIYDEKNNEPDCEMESKVALLKKIAEAVGVNLDEIFKKKE